MSPKSEIIELQRAVVPKNELGNSTKRRCDLGALPMGSVDAAISAA
jgi:hypothetical protein